MDDLQEALSDLSLAPPTDRLIKQLVELPEEAEFPSNLPFALSPWYITHKKECNDTLNEFGKRGSFKEAFVDLMEGMMGIGTEGGDKVVLNEIMKLQGAIEVLSVVMRNIKAKKPSSFVSTATQAIISACNKVLDDFSAQIEDEEHTDDLKKNDRSSLRPLFNSILEFIRSLSSSEQEVDIPWIGSVNNNYLDFVTAQSILSDFLLHVLVLFRSQLLAPRNLAARYFSTVEPKWRLPGQSFTDNTTGEKDLLFAAVESIASALGLGSERCLEIITSYTSSVSGSKKPLVAKVFSNDGDEASASSTELKFVSPPDLPTAQGAFLLLSSLYFPSSKRPRFSFLPSTLPFLSAFISINGSVSPSDPVDETLFWLFKCLKDGGGGWEKDDSLLFRLVSFVPMIACTDPDPKIRFVALRLLYFIILQLAPPPPVVKSRFKPREKGREDLQLLFLKDLLTSSPWKEVKAESVGILQAILQQKLSLPEPISEKEKKEQESIFRTPFLMEELKEVFWKLGDEKEEGMGVVGEDLNWVVKRLAFWYWLLSRDEKNITNIRTSNVIRAWDQNVLDPIKKRLEQMKNKAKEGGRESDQIRWEIDIVEENLARVNEAIAKCKI
ncbi:hypothetical protein BT69DRAFT_11443 [Atractiella rhizophila]|nr:hypothetical protein BT69DRAFT_11443 [Atractiella rhizophila]